MSTAVALADSDRDVLEAFAGGDTVLEIAADYGMKPSAVRNLLYRFCDFDQRRARLVLDGLVVNETEPEQPAPAPDPEPAPEPPPLPPATPGPSERPSLPAAITAAGDLTYRVLDYWTSRGYIQADKNNPGSGRKRHWSREEQEVARIMARLVAAGITPMGASHAARNGMRLLDPRVRIVIDEAPP